MRCLSAVVLTLLLAAVPAAGARADEESEHERTPAVTEIPGGAMRISPAQFSAAASGRRIAISVELDRAPHGGALVIELPRAFVRTPGSGLRATRPARAGAGDVVRTDRREVVVPFERLERRYDLSIVGVGVPAARYALPLRLRLPGGAEREAGTAFVNVTPAEREGDEAPAGESWTRLPREALNASSDSSQESETFIGADPGNPARMLAAANAPSRVLGLFSSDGGDSFAHLPFPSTAKGPLAVESSAGSCDPVVAADPATGALWFGGIAACSGEPGPVVLARVDAAGAITGAAALPAHAGSRAQDKPMVTFDGGRNRLYATWIDNDALGPVDPNVPADGGTFVDLAWCDAGTDGRACEDGAAWRGPIRVTAARGSYTYPDVAVAPGGDVYAVWWDYSAENAIRGAVCADPCDVNGFLAPRTIAQLDATGGRPLPFGCPVLVAPGGRVGAVPGVEVAPDGRVWVSWGDVRPGSGQRRCEAVPQPGGGEAYTPPSQDQMTWDAFAASAPGELPGGALPSAEAGTRLIEDGDERFAASSDEIFPWLAVDPQTGEAWAATYSTGADASRRSVDFYAVALAPREGGGLRTGPANRVSSAPSTHYSADPDACCTFQNDFGDYQGIAAAEGAVLPAWSDTSSGLDGEAFVYRGPLATVGFDLESSSLAEGPDADGDGAIEPGESFTLRPLLRNTGVDEATGQGRETPTVTLVVAGAGVVVQRSSAALPRLQPGEAGLADAPLQARVDPGYDCARPPEVAVDAVAAQGAERLPVVVPVACPEGAQVTPAPAPAPPRPGLLDLEVRPGQRLAGVLRRGLLVDVSCEAACRVRLAVGSAAETVRRLRVPRTLSRAAVRAAAEEPRVQRLRLTATARRTLRRAARRGARRFGVVVSASVADASPGAVSLMRRRTTIRP